MTKRCKLRLAIYERNVIGELKGVSETSKYRCVTPRLTQYGLDEREGQLEMVWILEQP